MTDLLTQPVLLEWGSLVLRWAHVMAGILWIGTSFYFIALDLSLRRTEALAAGIAGETWQVHGGGFYRMQKYSVAPPELPSALTWFRWESYATWITGFALLVWIYYLQADLYTIDPSVLRLPAWAAAGIGIGSLGLGWVIYDRLCRSSLAQDERLFAAVGLALLMLAAWGYGLVFGGRAAFLHTGALIATLMTGSVLFVIIPNQRIVVADLVAGRTPDPRLGKEAKLRSTHNNYLTLPVLFLMISNHYPMAYSSRLGFVVVGLIILAGALTRHFFNVHHAGRGHPWWTLAAASACFVLAAGVASTTPRSAPAPAVLGERAQPDEAADPRFLAAVEVITMRCAMCHADPPAWAGLGAPPRGVRLDTVEAIARYARPIQVHSVLTHAMPPNNITDMTREERAILAAWLDRR